MNTVTLHHIFCFRTWIFFTAHRALIVQYYSVICRPSDHTVARPQAEIRTRDGRSIEVTWILWLYTTSSASEHVYCIIDKLWPDVLQCKQIWKYYFSDEFKKTMSWVFYPFFCFHLLNYTTLYVWAPDWQAKAFRIWLRFRWDNRSKSLNLCHRGVNDTAEWKIQL